MNKNRRDISKFLEVKRPTKEATVFKVIADDQYYINVNKKRHKKEQNDLTLME